MIANGMAVASIGCLVMAPATALAFSVGDNWDWQLTEPTDLDRAVDVLDLHPDLVDAEELATLREKGIETICYVSIGTLEKGSSDEGSFPPDIIGKTYKDWPDERFLDIRGLDVLLPIMKKRFQACRDMGFDAVEPDNMDIHDNDSGFAVTADDVVAYVGKLAEVAHDLGLKIGQKNVSDLTGRMIGHMDFAITESCFQDGWCDEVSAYVDAGKPVFDAEYTDRPIDFAAACETAKTKRISMILKDRDLTAPVRMCP